jgi:hypothetical protein
MLVCKPDIFPSCYLLLLLQPRTALLKLLLRPFQLLWDHFLRGQDALIFACEVPIGKVVDRIVSVGNLLLCTKYQIDRKLLGFI